MTMKRKPEENSVIEEIPKNYCILALVFARIVKREFELQFQKQEISITTCCILCALREHGVLSQTELAHHILMDHATITRSINSLEERELVTRIKRLDDKRAYLVSLTPIGKRLNTKCMKVMDKLSDEIAEPLDSDDVTHLNNCLKKIISIEKTKIFHSNSKDECASMGS